MAKLTKYLKMNDNKREFLKTEEEVRRARIGLEKATEETLRAYQRAGVEKAKLMNEIYFD